MLCPFELRIPEKEFEFLKDQRSGRKMLLSAKVDRTYPKQRDAMFYLACMACVINTYV